MKSHLLLSLVVVAFPQALQTSQEVALDPQAIPQSTPPQESLQEQPLTDDDIMAIPEVWGTPQKKFWRKCLEDAAVLMKFSPKFIYLCEHHPHPDHLDSCPRFWELPPRALRNAKQIILDHCKSKTNGVWED